MPVILNPIACFLWVALNFHVVAQLRYLEPQQFLVLVAIPSLHNVSPGVASAAGWWCGAQAGSSSLTLHCLLSFVCDNCLKKTGRTRKENKFSAKSKFMIFYPVCSLTLMISYKCTSPATFFFLSLHFVNVVYIFPQSLLKRSLFFGDWERGIPHVCLRRG